MELRMAELVRHEHFELWYRTTIVMRGKVGHPVHRNQYTTITEDTWHPGSATACPYYMATPAVQALIDIHGLVLRRAD